jgi:hypothetical protein
MLVRPYNTIYVTVHNLEFILHLIVNLYTCLIPARSVEYRFQHLVTVHVTKNICIAPVQMKVIMEAPQLSVVEKSKLYSDQLNRFLTFKNKMDVPAQALF